MPTICALSRLQGCSNKISCQLSVISCHWADLQGCTGCVAMATQRYHEMSASTCLYSLYMPSFNFVRICAQYQACCKPIQASSVTTSRFSVCSATSRCAYFTIVSSLTTTRTRSTSFSQKWPADTLERYVIYIGWSDVTCLWSQRDRHFVGEHVVLCVVKWRRYVALFE